MCMYHHWQRYYCRKRGKKNQTSVYRTLACGILIHQPWLRKRRHTSFK